MSEHQVVVIGAGPSGVSVAVSLLDCGVRPLLVDRADYVGSSWRGRYDRLKLNTGRPLSHLPNLPYPQGTSIFPTRNDVAEHLHRHAHEDGIALRLATTVNRIDPSRVAGSYRRPLVILTRAKWSSPRVRAHAHALHPRVARKDSFTGELLHSSTYRNPIPLRGKRVLVVGTGSSGSRSSYWKSRSIGTRANVPARNTVSPPRDSIYAWCWAHFSSGVTPTCNCRADQSRRLRAQHR